MNVRVRNQIVNLSLEDDIDPNELTGNYLSPEEFLQQMQEENTVVIDARNDYEYDLGHFRGAIRPDIRTFRDLPQWIRDNKEQLEGKKVLDICTAEFVVRSFPVGSFVKVSKTLVNYTAALFLMEKTRLPKGSCGMDNVMYLTNG